MSTEHPLVGRVRELAQIRAAADHVAQGRSHSVYIEGFVGVGKNVLLREALKPYEQWREIAVVLVKEQSSVSGALLRQLVLPPDAPLRNQSVDELVALGLKRAGSVRRPTVITLINVQWIDPESAEALLRICTLLRDAAVLVVMCARPSSRPVVNRLSGFARNSPHATHVRVDPFLPAETRQLLERHLNTPLSGAVIERVQSMTSGYPLLVNELGLSLAEVPIGSRQLAAAGAAISAGSAAQRMRRALEETLETLGSQTRQALELLAASDQPLSRHQMAEALGHAVDLPGVLESGLAAWDEKLFGYKIRNGLITDSLLEAMCAEEVITVHRQLAKVVDGHQALQHRVQIARVRPGSAPDEELLEDLRTAAQDSLSRGDLERGFQSSLDIATLRPDARALQDLMHLGVSVGHLESLAQFESSIRCLASGPLRAAGLALIQLERGDIHEATATLQGQPKVSTEEPAALIYAQAVAMVSVQLGMRGLSGGVDSVKQATLEMLAVRDEDLARRFEAQTHRGPETAALEWERTLTAGLRALIRLWQILEDHGPQRTFDVVDRLSVELERLEAVPGTGAFQLGMRASRGAILRLAGDPGQAYADLRGTMTASPDLAFLTHSRAQLARILFMAGLWEEAKDVAAAAADRALLGREDSTALVAYLTWALIPVGRGDYDDVAPLVSEIAAVSRASGAMVTNALDLIHAWKAVIEGEHETTVTHLLRMRDDSGGWWNVGVEPMLLLVRAAHYAGWHSLVSSVHRDVKRGDSPARPELLGAVTEYIGAFESWRHNDPAAAMEGFVRADDWINAQPPLHPGKSSAESGGYRLLRAFCCLDMGALVIEHPEELRRHRATVIEGLEWASSVFSSAGSRGLLRMAEEELTELRPKLTPGRSSRSAQRAGAAPAEADREPAATEPRSDVPEFLELRRQEVATDPVVLLGGLSSRERQVAILIADGWTNREIAEELGISVRTVDFHVRNALTKFDVRSRYEIRQKLRGGVPRL